MSGRWFALAVLFAGVLAAAGAAPSTPLPRHTRHALIIAVGQYDDPRIQALPGTRHDIDSARQMAAAMAVPDDQVVILRDHEAGKEAIRAAISELAARVQPGDRAFVYFTGHGTRTFDPEVNKNACTEGLLDADGQVITNVEMAAMLQPVTARADKLLVFYDTCFSGGLAGRASRARGLALDGDTLTPKFSSVGAPELCAIPSNLRTRSLALVLQSEGSLPENVVHVAASRPDEVSFDSASRGGFATAAWRDCLLGQASDAEGGAVTAADVTRCAQTKVTAALANRPDISGQHLAIAGNAAYVPAWLGPTPSAAGVTSAPKIPPADLLAQVHRQRDGARSLEVDVNAATLHIGRDRLSFTVTSLHSGYVYVALAGSDGNSLYLLFPNASDGNNRIRAGRPLELPRPGWRLDAAGPSGRDTLLVMVTDAPRDLSVVPSERVGPFVRTLLDADGSDRLQAMLANGTPAASCGRGGADGPARDKCSDAFGSALVEVEEVR